MTKRKNIISVEERKRQAGLLIGALKGDLNPSTLDRDITTDSISAFLSGVYDQVKANNESVREVVGDDVYVLEVTVPDSNLRYLTLVHNGQIDMQLNVHFNDLEKGLLESGMMGYHSLDEALEEIFEKSPIPGIVKKPRKSVKKPEKPSTPPVNPNPRLKPYFILDPGLIKYLETHVDFLTAMAFNTKESGSIVPTGDIAGKTGLTEGFIQNLQNQELKISMRTGPGFLKNNQRKIAKNRKKRLEELSKNEDLTSTVVDFIEFIKDDEKGPNEFLSTSSKARDAYAYFTENPVDGVNIDEIFDYLREYATRPIKRDKLLCGRINKGLEKWICVAKAANSIDTNERLRRAVETFERVEVNDRLSERYQVSDRVYEGNRNLLVSMIDKSHLYSFKEYQFILTGLWFKGLITKTTGKGDKNRKVVDREPTGADVSLVLPAGHLMKKFDIYDGLLKPWFDYLLDQGKYKKGLTLNNKREDYAVGIELYKCAKEDNPDQVKSTFISLRNTGSVPLKCPLERPGTISMTSILQYYVGVQRNYFLDKHREFYDGK